MGHIIALLKLILGIMGTLALWIAVTLAAILTLLIIIVVLVGLPAGLLAPFIGTVPISYNFRSIRARWTSTIVAILGIAGTVGVFVAMLSLARGFKSTLVASGSTDNALVMRAGSTSEMMGGITLESIKVLQDAPGVARDPSGAPILTQDVVGVIPVPLITTGTDANVQVRGVSPNVLEVRKFVKIVQGRMFQSGLNELIVGKNASKTYQGLTVGNKIDFAGGHWTVVGIFDAGGSAFDSEVWCDSQIFNQVLQRPANIFQSATVHLASPSTFQQFKDAVTKDPRMNVDVYREIDYYAKQSTTMTKLITVLGGLVAAIMAIGAVFGALNTMYSAVAERGREIATMRAVGFSSFNVILSFLFEALVISLLGGILGCLAVLPLNGLTTSTMNFQTFSNVAFAFKITFDLLVMGVLFALVMGVLGGMLPAIRAAIQPVSVALREL
jgi:putative ABC transport system permease protein